MLDPGQQGKLSQLRVLQWHLTATASLPGCPSWDTIYPGSYPPGPSFQPGPSGSPAPQSLHPSWGVWECGLALMVTPGPGPPRPCQSPGTCTWLHPLPSLDLSCGSVARTGPGPLPSRPAAAPGQAHWLISSPEPLLGLGLM